MPIYTGTVDTSTEMILIKKAIAGTPFRMCKMQKLQTVNFGEKILTGQ